MKSFVISSLEKGRAQQAQGSFFFGAKSRPLTVQEVNLLKRQGNFCEDWKQIAVGPGFDTKRIHFCRFIGRVIFGHFASGWGLYSTTIEDAEMDHNVLIDRCSLVRKTMVSSGCRVIGSSIDCCKITRFGLGTIIHAGLESSFRKLPLWDLMTLHEAQIGIKDKGFQTKIIQAMEKQAYTFSFLAPDCEILHSSSLDGVFVGPGCKLDSVTKVHNAAFISSLQERIMVGPGVIIDSAILQWGSRVDTGAQIHRSILLEYAEVERQAIVSESLIGPNTAVGCGEVTASFLGPFIALHHQSLLIAAWWPQGRGNLGYGANVGSNHTSRAPDQEIWVGEGMFFGLDSVIKFPANFQDAPYTTIASAVVTQPQRLAFPFSLIVDESLQEAPGLNRIIPGWALKENTYALLRNEKKWVNRNKAQRHTFDLNVFRLEIAILVKKASHALENVKTGLFYTPEQLPFLGKNYLLEKDRQKAILAYRDFLTYVALKLFAEQALGQTFPLQKELKDLFSYVSLDWGDLKANLLNYLEQEKKLWESSIHSKRKDEIRGTAIIPDYQEFHPCVEEDPFLIACEKSWKKRKEEILSLLS